MGFLTCPQCGSINRDADPQCFQCQADLTNVEKPPPPPPPAPAADPVEDNYALNRQSAASSIGANKDKPKFKDLASRYEARKVPKTDAGLLHGWRSGGIAGLLCGVAMAFYRTKNVDETTKLLAKNWAKMSIHGADVVIASLAIDFLFGLIVGSILAAMGQLCFTPEASRTGLILGALIAAILVAITGQPYIGIALGAFHGYMLALLASFIENKVFRGN